MKYEYKAHPTEYAGVKFRSRLEARWAVFFDLIGIKWQYEPIDLVGWTPDFRVELPCGHSECNGSHVLLVEVKPYHDIKQFEGHPCLEYDFGGFEKEHGGRGLIPADASAAFGIDPSVTRWAMAHGSGGGEERLDHWLAGERVWSKWEEAGNRVQWIPRK